MKPHYGRERKSAKTLFSLILSIFEESKVRKVVEAESGVNPSYMTKILKKREDIFEVEQIPGLIPRSGSRQKIRLKLEERIQELFEFGKFNTQEKKKITQLILGKKKYIAEYFREIKELFFRSLISEHPIEFLEDPLWYFIAYNHLRVKHEFYENFIIEVQFGKGFVKESEKFQKLDKSIVEKYHKTIKEYVESGAFKSHPFRFVVVLPDGKEFKYKPEDFFPEEE